MNEQIDIAVFEDHPLLAAGLKAQLEQDHLLRLVWSTGDFKAFTQSLVAQPVGLLIADVIAPGVEGLRLFRYMADRHPKLPVIAYTSLNNLTLMRELYKLGVKGFVNKREPITVLQQAIERILSGQPAYPSSFPLPKSRTGLNGQEGIILTQRESEVLRLIIGGLLSKEIADRLGLSINTVNVHRTHLFEKFEVQNLAELIRQATYLGFVQD